MSDTATTPSGPKRTTLARVAEVVGGVLRGPPDLVVTGVASITDASASEMGFLGHPRYASEVGTTKAAALLVSESLAGTLPDEIPHVVVGEPYRALQKITAYLAPLVHAPVGVHPTAVLSGGVVLGPDVSVGPYAVLDSGASVGAGTRIGAHCVVGRGAEIGAECTLHPHVVLYDRVVVGDRVVIHAGARVGADGFGYVEVDGEQEKIPHTGGCVIGDDVEIGANATIDRGSIGQTRIEDGVKLDNLVHVAHNVTIGRGSLLAAQVGVAGSTKLGERVWMGGQSGAINQIEIGDDVRVVVQAGVTRDVRAGETVSGFPARPHREELKVQAFVRRLPKLARRLGWFATHDDSPGEE